MSIKTHRKIFFIFIFSYIAILASISAMNLLGADRLWFGALNQYLPQVIWAAPAIPLFIISLMIARRWIWAPLLCIIWVIGPIMGFCWSPHGLQKPPGSISLRVMTCNAKFGKHDISALLSDIGKYKPDLVLLQDAGGLLESPAALYFKSWNVRSSGQYIIASRFPLSDAEVRWMSFPGEYQPCLRCRLQFGASSITVYNVHLESPREGLNVFRIARRRPWYLPEAAQLLEGSVTARLYQASSIVGFLRQEQRPVIVAGDLNSPDSSQVCEILLGAGLHDAFAEGGRGYGYTYGHFLLQNRLPWLHTSWMRIDHIMLSSQFQTERCWTGTKKASDHRPVIADLMLNSPSTP